MKSQLKLISECLELLRLCCDNIEVSHREQNARLCDSSKYKCIHAYKLPKYSWIPPFSLRFFLCKNQINLFLCTWSSIHKPNNNYVKTCGFELSLDVHSVIGRFTFMPNLKLIAHSSAKLWQILQHLYSMMCILRL